jgi:hypothetical protein
MRVFYATVTVWWKSQVGEKSLAVPFGSDGNLGHWPKRGEQCVHATQAQEGSVWC